MNTPESIAKALDAEFTIQFRAGGNHVTSQQVADFISDQIRHGPKPSKGMPSFVWAYYTNGGKTLKFTFDKKLAEDNADGFTWDNPRVRRVGIIRGI